jgi:hypothetical protein
LSWALGAAVITFGCFAGHFVSHCWPIKGKFASGRTES